jgi:hypothetical protein
MSSDRPQTLGLYKFTGKQVSSDGMVLKVLASQWNRAAHGSLAVNFNQLQRPANRRH